MVRLIMGEKGTGKTKQLIELINDAAAHSAGSVVCIEAKSALTYDVKHQARLISADEYDVSSYESLRGFISGLYAGNYDISHIFIDNLFKIVDGICNQDADNFLHWLNRFSSDRGLKITVSISGNPELATDGMQKYL
ncbi:MAG: ATP-binding protein [Oscillospiraceae bacterium]|nr:ATP-binding protein [Oscillospiraceae bacterium]